jgi:hypothetical protein
VAAVDQARKRDPLNSGRLPPLRPLVIIGPCIRDLWIFKVLHMIVGNEIPDLSTQQQGTESILVNSESLLFVDLCYRF